MKNLHTFNRNNLATQSSPLYAYEMEVCARVYGRDIVKIRVTKDSDGWQIGVRTKESFKFDRVEHGLETKKEAINGVMYMMGYDQYL